MTSRVSRRVAVCLLGFAVGVTGQAWGTTIAVTNPGFENPTLANGTAAFALVGWAPSAPNVAGTWNPPNTAYPAEAPEGQNVSFVNGAANFVVQTLGEVVTAGLTYTLQVDVGRRLDQTGMAWDYSVDLITGGSGGGTILAQDVSTLLPSRGQFLTSTVTYTAPLTGPVIGQPLAIRLSNRNTEQVNFDDVRLTAIPLPAAIYLFGSGLLGMIAIARRKKVI